jgi:hypothetical protein
MTFVVDWLYRSYLLSMFEESVQEADPSGGDSLTFWVSGVAIGSDFCAGPVRSFDELLALSGGLARWPSRLTAACRAGSRSVHHMRGRKCSDRKSR